MNMLLEISLRRQEHMKKKNGKNVIYLNIGDPVQYDFPTPDHIKNALIKAVQSDENFYTASEGLPELRQAIVEKEKGKGFGCN
ncbi:MAG TPA: hypothetical protein VF222_08990 [Nitrososphaeraceae archaeon]